jgi:hypothetical protein
MKKMFKVPGEKQKPTAKLRVDTCCPVCLWQGDFMETLLVMILMMPVLDARIQH